MTYIINKIKNINIRFFNKAFKCEWSEAKILTWVIITALLVLMIDFAFIMSFIDLMKSNLL